MLFIRMLAGSALGAAIGGAIWVYVGYICGYELAFVALLVGLFAGAGAKHGSKGEGEKTAGVIAALLAAITVIVAGPLTTALIQRNLNSQHGTVAVYQPDMYDLFFLVLAVTMAYRIGSRPLTTAAMAERSSNEDAPQ